MSSPCSVMIFTKDEEAHLAPCLASVRWCDDVIVIDSFSTDRTLAISKEAGATVYQHRFEGLPAQRNWALGHVPVKHEWILMLDADERVPPEMVVELRERLRGVPADVAAFSVARRFHMWGRWLRYSSLYPTYVVRLVRRGRVTFADRGHGEIHVADGATARLRADLIDENLKGIDEWFERQNRYSSAEARYELEQEGRSRRLGDLFSADPLVRRAAVKRLAAVVPGRAGWYFLYTYVLRGGFRDGYDGLVFCLMRAVYQAMISIKKHDRRRAPGEP